MTADDHGKICPRCGTVNRVDACQCSKWDCRHLFVGDELGVKPESVRIETESQVLTDDQIESHLAAPPVRAAEDRAAHKKDAECLRGRLLVRARLAAIGILLFAVGWYVKTSFLSGVQARNEPNLVVLAYGAIGAGILLLILTAIQIGMCVRWYRRGPELATPEEVVKTFYTGLGVGAGNGSVGRAWACLDPVARSRYTSVDDFEKYWENGLSDLKQSALQATAHVWSGHRPKRAQGEIKCRFILGTSMENKVTGRVAKLGADILVESYDEVIVGFGEDAGVCELCYGGLVVPQSKTLVKCGDRWYLTSGTLDGPRPNVFATGPGDRRWPSPGLPSIGRIAGEA